MKCPKCGVEIEEGVTVCPVCSEVLVAEDAAQENITAEAPGEEAPVEEVEAIVEETPVEETEATEAPAETEEQ